MAGVPKGQKRLNLNITNELHHDLALAQASLDRPMAAVVRAALIDYFQRSLPEDVLVNMHLSEAIRMGRPPVIENNLSNRSEQPPVQGAAQQVVEVDHSGPQEAEEESVPGRLL